MSQRRPAVFLDKDGTLIEDVPFNVDPRQIVLERGAVKALRAIRRAGFALMVTSNQSGVALGKFPLSSLRKVEDRIQELLARGGVSIDAFYWCPHHPEGSVLEYRLPCDCRKPAPGLLLQAAREHDLDLSRSWFVGDILNDVEAGRRAGCRTILVANGNETEWILTPDRVPHHIVAELDEAAEIICGTLSTSEPTWSLPIASGRKKQ